MARSFLRAFRKRPYPLWGQSWEFRHESTVMTPQTRAACRIATEIRQARTALAVARAHSDVTGITNAKKPSGCLLHPFGRNSPLLSRQRQLSGHLYLRLRQRLQVPRRVFPLRNRLFPRWGPPSRHSRVPLMSCGHLQTLGWVSRSRPTLRPKRHSTLRCLLLSQDAVP